MKPAWHPGRHEDNRCFITYSHMCKIYGHSFWIVETVILIYRRRSLYSFFTKRACRPGGHFPDYNLVPLTFFKSSPCDPFDDLEDQGPVNEIYRRPMLKWDTRLHGKVAEMLPQQGQPGDIPHYYMMTSSNGNIFRVTGHLCGEFTGPRWILRTKASDAELWCFLWSTPE